MFDNNFPIFQRRVVGLVPELHAELKYANISFVSFVAHEDEKKKRFKMAAILQFFIYYFLI